MGERKMILTLLLIGVPLLTFIIFTSIYFIGKKLFYDKQNKAIAKYNKEYEECVEYNSKRTYPQPFKAYPTRVREYEYDWDTVGSIAWFSLAMAVVTIIILTVILLIANINVKTKVIKLEAKRDIIVAKVERLQNGVFINGDLGSLEDTYSDVIEFNDKIISHREYSSGYWLNWFYRAEIGNIKLIDINGGTKK